VWRLAREMVKEFSDDGVSDLAAAITFWTVLSVPAAVLALVSALSSLDRIVGSSTAEDVEREVQEFIADQFVNSQTISDTVTELFNTSSRGVTIVATLVALFTLSRAFAGLIRALDTAYDVPNGRRWWHGRLVAFGLGIGTLLVVAGSAFALAFIPELPLGGFIRWLTIPIVLAVLTIWAATIFHIGPNHRTPWRFDVPGAIVTALGWAISTQLFALYVRVSSSVNQVQSTIGTILLALTLMYLLSVVLILGAEMNEIISRRAGVVQDARSVVSLARDLRERYIARPDGDDPPIA
jgi:membrane protein